MPSSVPFPSVSCTTTTIPGLTTGSLPLDPSHPPLKSQPKSKVCDYPALKPPPPTPFLLLPARYSPHSPALLLSIIWSAHSIRRRWNDLTSTNNWAASSTCTNRTRPRPTIVVQKMPDEGHGRAPEICFHPPPPPSYLSDDALPGLGFDLLPLLLHLAHFRCHFAGDVVHHGDDEAHGRFDYTAQCSMLDDPLGGLV